MRAELGSEAQRARVAAKVRSGLSFAPITAEEEVVKALRELVPSAVELRPKVQSLRNPIAGRGVLLRSAEARGVQCAAVDMT